MEQKQGWTEHEDRELISLMSQPGMTIRAAAENLKRKKDSVRNRYDVLRRMGLVQKKLETDIHTGKFDSVSFRKKSEKSDSIDIVNHKPPRPLAYARLWS